jgi:hypothetical protein
MDLKNNPSLDVSGISLSSISEPDMPLAPHEGSHRGHLNKKKAKLLRAFVRFMEYPEHVEHVTKRGATLIVKNPMIEELKTVFRTGASDVKHRLSELMRKRMGRTKEPRGIPLHAVHRSLTRHDRKVLRKFGNMLRNGNV